MLDKHQTAITKASVIDTLLYTHDDATIFSNIKVHTLANNRCEEIQTENTNITYKIIRSSFSPTNYTIMTVKLAS